MVSPKERPRTLNRLCKKCETERDLPGSMVVTFSSLKTDRTKLPEDGGGFADVYRGKYKGREAAVKLMRVYTSSNRELFLSVCITSCTVRGEPSELVTYRGSAGRPLCGDTYGIQMFYRCLLRRWTCKIRILHWFQSG
jgi:hypothetical protein